LEKLCIADGSRENERGRIAKEVMVGWLAKIFGGSGEGEQPPAPDEGSAPFMEHPSGDFKTAVDAMADAIERLRALPQWDNGITFTAQGMGHREDSYHEGEIRMRGDEIEVETPVDANRVSQVAGVAAASLIKRDGHYVLIGTSPIQAARIFDAIFREHLGIRPHSDEGNDDAVGAEW
jgi:hypothetical protein